MLNALEVHMYLAIHASIGICIFSPCTWRIYIYKPNFCKYGLLDTFSLLYMFTYLSIIYVYREYHIFIYYIFRIT